MNHGPDLSATTEGDGVTVELTRWDLIRLNLAVTLRQRWTWITCVFLAICVATLFLSAIGLPGTVCGVLIAVALVTLVPSALLLFGLLLSTALTLVWAGSSSGVLGAHTYLFEEHGLRETTLANDTLIKWGGAQDVQKIGWAIVVKISPILFHLVPFRCFRSAAAYDAFWVTAQRLKEKRIT